MVLHKYERKVLRVLKMVNSLDEIVSVSHLNKDAVSRALYWLQEKGLVKIDEKVQTSQILTKEAEKFLKKGFPELNVVKKAILNKKTSELTEEEKKIGLAWAAKNKWINIKNGNLIVTPLGKTALDKKAIEKACQFVADGKPLDKFSKEHLLKRNLIEESTIKSLSAKLTAKGEETLKNLPPDQEELTVLTHKDIVTGEWKKRYLIPYNVTINTEEVYPGKRHILSLFINKIKSIFAEMGFEEMEGDIIQSSFWNFDALFQPQDHPARDLADTFYLKESYASLPENAELIRKVKKVHEEGWHYKWDRKEAEKNILRTHTTAVSSKYLYKKCQDKKPHTFYCVGKTYRNESIDFKHLAEFYQVEGILVWENATFAQLLGLLKEFYKKLGFEKIRFVPAYFPYTEPSLEIEVFFPGKKEWIELGGAGIFRPEVSLPLCNRFPVLAWGLSLERPLMLMYDIPDIRTFYKNNISWLRMVESRF